MSDIGHSGLCMICGKPINIVPVLGNFPDIFFCPECEKKISNAKEKEDDKRKSSIDSYSRKR